MSEKRFAVIGVAGYIAPRHVQAIKETGNTLIAALDKFDCVGFLDQHFPDADFFTEFERFDRHLDKLKRSEGKIDYVSICSPNYLHDSHIRFALRSKCTAICEKPLVLNPWNVEALSEIEKNTGQRVYTILQLRLHPSIIQLKKMVENSPADKVYDIDLSYITSRGNWYHFSWKGEKSKSGGIATNIGVHFFDMLGWIFGDVKENTVHYTSETTAAGYLEFKKARVRWILSIDYNMLPDEIKVTGERTYRSLLVEGEEFEFSKGFTDLHTTSYKEIIAGNGFGLSESKPSIEIVHHIRNSSPTGMKDESHPLCKKILNL